MLTGWLGAVTGPILLGCPSSAESEYHHDEKPPPSGEWKKLPAHDDESQVQLDVDRSFIYYPTSMQPRSSGVVDRESTEQY